MKQVSSLFVLMVWLLILSNTSFGKSQEPDVIHPKSQPFEILYFEDLPEMAFQALAEKSGDYSSQASPLTWSFEAFGKAFHMLLHPNARLLAKIPQEKRAQLEKDLTFYRGTLEGISGSWVRLTRSDQTWSGMIWDGQDAYIIDSLSLVTPALQTVPSPTASGHSIYRISDTRDLGNRICGMEGARGTSAHPMTSFGALMEELEARVGIAAQGATQNIDMAVVTDQEFNRANNNPNAAVIARMNIVDGIFSEQLGVQISLVDVLPVPPNGGLTSTNAGTLLNQFSQFSDSASFDHPGIAHLFTGRNLDGRTVGIAYYQSLCSARFGIGIDQITGTGAAGALTVAHELGHNFGAPHDNEDGSPCSSTPGTFLMNPVLNGSDQFSPCSISQIQPVLNGASCLTVINTSPPPPPPPPSSLTISNLTVANGNVYALPSSGLQVGATVYRDRSYTVRTIPANVRGAAYIQTANDDKAATTANFLSFRVNQPVDVYIAHDRRITPKPSWLSTFTNTGTNLVTSDTPLRLFVRSFPAGTITLGGNRVSGTGGSMYSVMIKAAGGANPPPPPPPPPPPSSLTISNLTVASGKVYALPSSGLQVGATVYRDRSYTVRTIPANVRGAAYIQTANNDKKATTANFLSFRVNQPVDVYIAHDRRITPKPSWLSTFTDTGTNLVTSDTPLRLFVRSFPAGTITLGGNRVSGTGGSMYSVIVKP